MKANRDQTCTASDIIQVQINSSIWNYLICYAWTFHLFVLDKWNTNTAWLCDMVSHNTFRSVVVVSPSILQNNCMISIKNFYHQNYIWPKCLQNTYRFYQMSTVCKIHVGIIWFAVREHFICLYLINGIQILLRYVIWSAITFSSQSSLLACRFFKIIAWSR